MAQMARWLDDAMRPPSRRYGRPDGYRIHYSIGYRIGREDVGKCSGPASEVLR
jgi:hypothetical protein